MQMSRLGFSIWLTLAVMCAIVSQPMYGATTLDRVVAIVNDEVITQGQLDQQLSINKQVMQQPGAQQESASQLRKDTLNQLIDEAIMAQMSKRYGLKITPDQVTKTIDRIAASNNMSVDQLKQTIQGQGLTWAEYQQQINQQLLDQQLYNDVISASINVNPAEVDQVMTSPQFNQSHVTAYHLGDILIPLPDNPTPEEVASAKATAQNAMQALQQGKPFADVAAQYSSAGDTPDLGWRAPADLPSVFLDAASTMKVGDVHAPIQTGNGWHVLKLIDIQGQVAGAHSTTQTHARHILIAAKHPSDDGPVKAELESIRNQALHGGDFAALAQKYSQDPGSAVKGGDLGWVVPGEMVPQFEDAMNKTAVGQISEPIKTQFGWHIIQVLARKDVDDTQDYKQMLAKNYIFQEKMSQARTDWLARMRASSYIKIMPDPSTPADATPTANDASD